VRHLIVLLFALLAVPLIGASSPLAIKPTVIVYPFTANGTAVNAEASSRLATIIATQMANSKQVTVIPAPPGTERKDYLTVARANNADFYVAGFISPLGSGVSVVEQVVTSRGGIVAFSNTAQLQTYADASGQGDELAQAIAAYANRGFASIASPPPATSPSPSANEGSGANIGALFNRKKGGKNQPSPAASSAPATAAKASPAPANVAAAPKAAPPAPSNGSTAIGPLYVIPVSGGAAEDIRNAAAFRLATHEQAKQVDQVLVACTEHPTATIMKGTLSEGHHKGGLFGGGAPSATFVLALSDCSGREFWRTSQERSAGTTQAAMDAAVDAAVAAFDRASTPPAPGT
jgi:hypothetical protein